MGGATPPAAARPRRPRPRRGHRRGGGHHPLTRFGRSLVPGCLRPCAERLAVAVRPEAADRVLDLLSGGGIMLAALERAGAARAVAVDEQAAFLGTAGAGHDVRLRVAAVRASAERLPVRDGAATVVTSLPGPMHAEDPAAALREMARVLAPGGRLACLAWGAGARHEAVLAGAMRAEGLPVPAPLDRLVAAPAEIEELVTRAGAAAALVCRQVHDVVRFDGVDHYWAAMVLERPWVTGGPMAADPRWRRVRARCAGALERDAAPDGTLRIPVDLVVVLSPAAVDG